METAIYIILCALCAAVGYLLGRAQAHPRPQPDPPEETKIPEDAAALLQWQNLFDYDGSERGQRSIGS